MMSTENWVIEFRPGTYLQTPENKAGGPAETAMKFRTKSEAESCLAKHVWIFLDGGMVTTLHQ